MSEPAVRKLLEEYNSRARKLNVTTQAISVLLKKLAIAEFKFDIFDVEIVEFARRRLEQRYQSIFFELVEAHQKLVSDMEFNTLLEVELFHLSEEIDRADEVDESTVLVYETGREAQSQIDRIAKLDVVHAVSWVRDRKKFGNEKIDSLSKFITVNIDEKLQIQVLAV
jgi:regulator of replication initiation timing